MKQDKPEVNTDILPTEPQSVQSENLVGPTANKPTNEKVITVV